MKKVLELIEAALNALAACKAAGPRADSIKAHLESCASNAKAEVAQAAAQAAAAAAEKAAAEKAAAAKTAGFTRVGLLAVLCLIAAIGVLLTARTKADSFNVTNIVASGVALTGPATNVAGVRNGTPISVANNDFAGFYFKGYSSTNTNSTVTVSLVRGWPPSVSTWYEYDSTGTNVDGVYWEGSASKTLSISITGSGVQSWFTNLEPEYVRGASAIAILTVTNSNAGVGSIITNADFGLNKKIIPIRYP